MLRFFFSLLFAATVCVFAQDGSDVPDFPWDVVTPLDDYVHREDGMFNWYIHDVIEYDQVRVLLVNMTSQRWLDDSMVTRSVWWHQMGIAIPDEISREDTAFLFVDGGSNSDPDDWPDRLSYFNLGVSWVANDTGMVSAWMRQVPNQSIRFYDDPDESNRSEDRLIAYTWKWVVDKLLAGEEPNLDIVLRCPMTKAAKRGLDAVAGVALQEVGTDINQFVVSGASKRGWTAWSLAATDRRVIATAPLVYSLLYFEESFMAHFQALDGAWSFALEPYFDEDLTYYLTDPIMAPVFDIEDPFRYRSRLEPIPKLMVSATGDEFFLNQDSHYFWHLLGGTKHMMMNPNAEHALFPHWFRILDTIMSWTMIVVFEGQESLPYVTSSREQFSDFARVTLTTDTEPIRVRGLVSETLSNNTRRDFRLFAGHPDRYPQPIPWRDENATLVDDEGMLTWAFDQEYPEGDIWRGFFLEAMWTSDYFERDMWFTSEVNIIPDELPAPPCVGDDCYGSLV